MSDYILPDEDLRWTSNNGGVPKNSEKYTITYENGRRSAAQNGGNIRLPSRVSMLTIHSPTVDDNGKFTCAIHGTAEFIVMDLKVEGGSTEAFGLVTPDYIKPRETSKRLHYT